MPEKCTHEVRQIMPKLQQDRAHKIIKNYFVSDGTQTADETARLDRSTQGSAGWIDSPEFSRFGRNFGGFSMDFERI